MTDKKYGPWVAGLAIGLIFGLIIFNDQPIIGAIFGVSIGIAFALALGAVPKAGKRDRPDR